jgi:hypothetical protein
MPYDKYAFVYGTLVNSCFDMLYHWKIKWIASKYMKEIETTYVEWTTFTKFSLFFEQIRGKRK